MRRLHLFEILDQPWCPKVVRDGATDFLEHITNFADIYAPVRPLLACGNLARADPGTWLIFVPAVVAPG